MDTNIGRAAKVMTMFLLITSVLVTIARGVTKAIIVRSATLDDYLIALSLVSRTSKCSTNHEMGVQLTWSLNIAV